MSDIKDTLIDAAKRYYAYLDANDLGLSEIHISHCMLEGEEFIIALKGNMADMEVRLNGDLLLKVEHELYKITETDDIKPRFFDEKQKVFYLSLKPKLVPIFAKILKEKRHIALFSDLKFLVKNVEEFFTKYGEHLSLPQAISPCIVPHIAYLSDEQSTALNMVLNTPLSYVWGPPGTGKTQAVLFEALLHYIKAGKRVAVVTSTNNALEQVLKSLIKKFDALGLERTSILRLGTPTLQYMNTYPQTCDPSLFQRRQDMSLFNFQDSLKTRLKQAFVVGVTLDGFIKRYEGLELTFHHIFLDECAYAPLIKTCALCVDNTPLSFFGDHKQLSPVCEMPLNELRKAENEHVYAWTLSALFLESFLKGSPLKELANLQTPPLAYTCLSKLSKTHRYGDNLAHILDTYIYHMGLKGNGEQMQILAIDSGTKSEGEQHISENEARACEQLCLKLRGEDYAVITPFVKQRKRLCKGIPRDRIFTIHGSQGQEFDSVIFSPVSLHYHLTNSSQINALYALNVAISRIKKRLFIVCDYKFWIKQEGQLIWAILQQAQMINIESKMTF
ncbi:hypothetical protein LS71_005020 [Helicobacter jaachi]|uniref:RNA helicase n=1 Tax=Helicobacter jaachi TaxID=1677920 RepID=A0A4U8TB97_9HELI|nr:AAA domain-containing protein [Helicobacter jaachi]TLD96954.1 hypothetical protein LS71_005020 [Helicobacter jaachi]